MFFTAIQCHIYKLMLLVTINTNQYFRLPVKAYTIPSDYNICLIRDRQDHNQK